MSRFNTKNQTNKKHSAIKASEPTTNHMGAVAYGRDTKSDLYLLAVSFMGGDGNFYESSDERYARLTGLAREVAVKHSTWFGDFVNWVRNSAKMRTAAGVIAVEGVLARLEFMKTVGDEKTITSQGKINREIIDAACARADEPGEILAYYLSKYGKPLPYPIKKGLGDAATRLYTQRGYLRYAATTTSSVGMADVIRLCRPKPLTEEQSHLFNYITEFEHRGPDAESTLAELENLPKVFARRRLMGMAPEERKNFISRQRDHDVFKYAEMGWENISAWLGHMDKEAWEAVIPNMGVMALLRNLRNFDKVGISDQFATQHVMSKIMDPEEIKKANVLPMRFLSAYRAAPSLRWAWPLEQGLNACLENVPAIGGRNLFLIDVSPSMKWAKVSAKSDLLLFDAGAIFGAVMAAKNPDSTLVQFGGTSERVKFSRGESVLKIIEKFHEIGWTRIPDAVREWYDGHHDRVIIVTDEQSANTWGRSEFEESMDGVRAALPNRVPVYTWNLAGYRGSITSTEWPNTHIFGGGFSDSAFGMIKHIESGRQAAWPWELA